MSETSALRFQQAYDEARASITSSLSSVKETYEGIQRDLSNEIKASDLEKKELAASLNEANNKIEGLNGVVKGLENSLATSKDLAASTQKTLEVCTQRGVAQIFCLFFCPKKL
jgi:sugar-specific transcriptional regulator TrmB